MDEINKIPAIELFAQGHRACSGCGAALAMRLSLKASGKSTIVSHATGCMEVVSTPYPETAWRVPWIHVAFENAAATASGIDLALRKLGRRDGTNVMCIGGDGGTFDIGLQALSGAAERGNKFCYVCYDNGAYMNCLSLDTFVSTESGLKRISEIKTGEKVYAFSTTNHNLVLKRCIGVFDNGIKKVYEVSTLHHSIKATSNHPFLVLNRKGEGNKASFEWKTVSQLKKGDKIVSLSSQADGKSFRFENIKLSKKGDYKINKINKVILPEASSPELMEFLGLFVGDGWVRPDKAETGIAVPEKNRARARRLLGLCSSLFGKSIMRHSSNYLYLYSGNLSRFIDSLGFGREAKNKLIPPWVFTLPLGEKEAFLRGLMLSDGYSYGNSCRYVSASPDLLKTLRLLLQGMGYRVGMIHFQKKPKGAFVVYRQLLADSSYGYICFSRQKKPMGKYRSQARQSNFFAGTEGFSTEKVVSVRYCGEEPTLDLRVEGEHNFIADGIVVHNTGIQRSGATPKYASTTTSPAGKAVHGKRENKKNLPLIMAAHGCYVATANVAYPQDFVAKVRKALEFNGVGYVQVFAPCPTGWKHPGDLTIRIAKLAFQSKVTPLFEITPSEGLRFTSKPSSPAPVSEYLKTQGRFRHMSESEIADVQKLVDDEYDRLIKMEQSGVRL